MQNAARLATGWWTRTPARIGRWSPLLSAAWTDGFYLTTWPRLAVLLPMLALLIGFIEGVTHWSFHTLWDGGTNPRMAVTFVQMLPLLYLAAVAGAFSAQLGLLLVFGFAAGDWFLGGPAFQYLNLSRLGHLLQVGLPQLISYGLFFLLAVQPTIAARLMAGSLGWPARRSGAARFWFVAVVAAVLQGVIVYAWTFSAPMLVRPIWMWAWHNEWPPLTIPYFTGSQRWTNPGLPDSCVNPGLPIAAAVAALLRAGLTLWTRRSESVASNAKKLKAALAEANQQPAFTRRMPAWVEAITSALAVTLLLGGFIATLWLGIGIFAVLAAILVIRAVVLPGVPGWNAWMALAGKVPLLFRWLAAVGTGYLIARLVYLTPSAAVQANQAAGAFGPELVSIILGFVVTALLLPAGRSTPSRPIHVQLGTNGAQAAAAMVLLVGLVGAKPALAFCADSSCCFTDNTQAILAIAALIVLLSTLALLLAPEAAALAALRMLFGAGEVTAEMEAEADLGLPAASPTGEGGSPMDIPRGTNDPTTIGDRYFSGHALDEMQSDGIPPSVVEDTISNGSSGSGNLPDTVRYYSRPNNVTVITNSNGDVVTVYRGGRKYEL